MRFGMATFWIARQKGLDIPRIRLPTGVVNGKNSTPSRIGPFIITIIYIHGMIPRFRDVVSVLRFGCRGLPWRRGIFKLVTYFPLDSGLWPTKFVLSHNAVTLGHEKDDTGFEQ